jgi:hypothetical protein
MRMGFHHALEPPIVMRLRFHPPRAPCGGTHAPTPAPKATAP